MTATEDKCPSCGSKPCYVPMLFGRVECCNKNCEHYSASRYPVLPVPGSDSLLSAESLSDLAETPVKQGTGGNKDHDKNFATSFEDAEGPVYLWSNYHHDFGD